MSFHRFLESEADRFAKQAMRTLRKFETTCHREVGICCDDTHIATRANCIIELYAFWEQFCERIFKVSSLGRAVSSGGVYIPRASNLIPGENLMNALRRVSSVSAAVSYAGWQPRWGISRQLTTALRDLGTANAATISAAVNASNSPSEKLRSLRNYYAHKNLDTAEKAKIALRTYPPTRPYSFDSLLQVPTRAGTTSLYEEWVYDLIAVAYAACA